jgi:hypothetical protein
MVTTIMTMLISVEDVPFTRSPGLISPEGQDLQPGLIMVPELLMREVRDCLCPMGAFLCDEVQEG